MSEAHEGSYLLTSLLASRVRAAIFVRQHKHSYKNWKGGSWIPHWGEKGGKEKEVYQINNILSQTFTPGEGVYVTQNLCLGQSDAASVFEFPVEGVNRKPRAFHSAVSRPAPVCF